MKAAVNDIEDIFVRLERIFFFGGVWPMKSTYIRFTMYITYFTVYLVLAYADLIDVFGNLELVVMNLVETMVYTITYVTVWMVRCSKLLERIVSIAKAEIANFDFENFEEVEIYRTYNYMSKMFCQISTVGMLCTVTFFYFRPLLQSLFASNDADLPNAIQTRELPLRIYTYFQLSNARTYALMYFCLCPVIYMSMCHITAICMLVALVFHICGKLCILSYRIRNMKLDSRENADEQMSAIIQMHMKIIWMARSLASTFNVILLDELIGNSVILAISTYYALVNLDILEVATCCSFAFFAFTALMMLFGYCLVGDQLIQQSVNVQDAFYCCDWYQMSSYHKTSLLICMIYTQRTFRLTGGGFYTLSLTTFTDIMRTSAAYLSLLRTIL